MVEWVVNGDIGFVGILIVVLLILDEIWTKDALLGLHPWSAAGEFLLGDFANRIHAERGERTEKCATGRVSEPVGWAETLGGRLRRDLRSAGLGLPVGVFGRCERQVFIGHAPGIVDVYAKEVQVPLA